MSSRRGGLGRGLGALIPPAPPTADPPAADPPAADVAFREVPTSAITPNSRQPRHSFDEQTLDELTSSIREVGLLQPIVVRQLPTDRYELVMGERRWRACVQAGLERIPVIVRPTGDDAMLRDALLENLHREQLNPLDEAAAYRQLLDDFGATHEELAGRLGRSRSQLTNTLRLLNLPPTVQRRVAAGVLSAGHARALLALDDPAEQDRLAARIVAEGLSVRTVEEVVAAGEGPSSSRRPRARRSARSSSPELSAVAERLSEHFDTPVTVTQGRSRGKIVIEFGGADDLDRIVAVMAPISETGTSDQG